MLKIGGSILYILNENTAHFFVFYHQENSFENLIKSILYITFFAAFFSTIDQVVKISCLPKSFECRQNHPVMSPSAGVFANANIKIVLPTTWPFVPGQVFGATNTSVDNITKTAFNIDGIQPSERIEDLNAKLLGKQLLEVSCFNQNCYLLHTVRG